MVVSPAVLLGVSQAPQNFQHGEVVDLLSACYWDGVGEVRATGGLRRLMESDCVVELSILEFLARCTRSR